MVSVCIASDCLSCVLYLFFTEPVITGRQAYKVRVFYELNHQHNDCGWPMIAEVAKLHPNLRLQKEIYASSCLAFK
jgi:hypothetical protein